MPVHIPITLTTCQGPDRAEEIAYTLTFDESIEMIPRGATRECTSGHLPGAVRRRDGVVWTDND